MSITETRATLKASIWQAVAQSGVNVSVLSQQELDKLVEAITERLLSDIDALFTEAAGGAVTQGDDDPEKILWEGRPFLSMSLYYQITSERVRIRQGLFGKEQRDIELIRIQDIDHKQNLTERTLNIGDVFIRGADISDPEIELNNVTAPAEVHEILREAVLKARKKHKMSFREEM